MNKAKAFVAAATASAMALGMVPAAAPMVTAFADDAANDLSIMLETPAGPSSVKRLTAELSMSRTAITFPYLSCIGITTSDIADASQEM